MRILVATDQWFPDLRGGSARVAADTARELARRGHDVTVLAPRNGREPLETREGSLRVRRVLARTALPQTFTDVLQTRRSALSSRQCGFDLLLAHQSTTAVGLLGARIAAPLVLVYHASAPRELRFLRSRLPWGARRLTTYVLEPPLVLLERVAVRRASRVLALSEYSLSLLQHDHPEVARHARRVSGGVDTDSFSPGDGARAARVRLGVRSGVPLLVTVRRLEPRMGLEQLLHAVPRLTASRDLTLAIVGEGTLGKKLQQLTAALRLQDRVWFVGRASEAELRDWYRAADLFVLPTVAYEGFGMVTAEALASGTPVVGTPVGATPELLRPLEHRLIARGSNPDDLAVAIAEALTFATPQFRRRCREYASARFAWDKAILGWEQALAEAAGQSPTFESAVLDDSGGLG